MVVIREGGGTRYDANKISLRSKDSMKHSEEFESTYISEILKLGEDFQNGTILTTNKSSSVRNHCSFGAGIGTG